MVDKSVQLANRIVEYIKNSIPITTDNGLELTINNIKVDIPESNYDIDNQLNMKYSGNGNTEGYIGGSIKVTNRAGSKVYGPAHYKHLVTFPVVTERGTYIVNGVEKNIISQMRMKSGCYTNNADKGTVKTQLRFDRNKKSGEYMPAITLVLDPVSNVFNVEIKSYNKKVKFNIVNFMVLLGFNDMEIKKSLGDNHLADSIFATCSKKRNDKTIDQLYRLFFPKTSVGSNLNEAQKRDAILSFFAKNASFGDGSVISTNLGINANNTYLNKEVISKAVKKTVSVASGLIEEDVKDEIKFKDIYSDSDLIFEAIATGLDNFFQSVKGKMENFEPGAHGAVLMTGMQDMISAPLTSRKDGLMQSELCVSSEEINPLFMEAKQREISQGGPNGTSKNSMRNETDARNLTPTGMNKIDPVETPESSKIGFTQHLTVGAVIENNTIKSEFLRVLNGEAVVGETNKVRLAPAEEENMIIAFNDSRYLKEDGNKLVFTQDVVPARYMGKRDMYPVNKIQYIDAKPQSVLGTSANMIPFVSHNDGARTLMGAAMQKQAVNLVNREAPMVTTLADKSTGLTFDQKIGEQNGKPVKSTVNGIVHKITKSHIIVLGEDGQEYKHSYYNYYPLNQSYINNELRVKVGDKVNEGQLLAEGWQTQGGKLALGVNARIGYLPFKGYNYEDGVVISESFAQKMTSDEYNEVEILIPKEAKGGRGSKIKSALLKETTNASVSLLDEDGIIKIGETIKAGSVLVGYLKEITKSTDDLLDLIALGSGKISYKYSEKQVPAGSYVSGKIERITVIDNPDAVNKQKIVFSVVKKKPLKLGDKIAGRHGNKGIITKILPDKLMPVGEDNKKLDLMMSPLAVPSRKNPGQLFEVAAGLIAEKTGKPFVVDNFNHNEKERVLEQLKAIGFEDGKMKVTLKEEDENGNIVDVPVENKVTVGNMYIMKLKHKVDDKIQARSNYETPVSQKTHMPTKVVGTAQGEKSNPQRLGEMEMRALQAHGATWNLLESATIKSDGAGDGRGKAAIYKAIATGNLDAAELSKSATPETVKVFADTLKVLGLDVKPMYNGVEVGIDKPFNSLGLAPMNQNEFLKTIGKDKEVYVNQAIQARQFYGDKNSKTDKKDKAAPEVKGGLLDTNIFGEGTEEDRDKWGYIKLPMPVPNPLFMESASNNIYEVLTGLKKSELKELTGIGTKVTVTDDMKVKGKDTSPKAIITDVSSMDSMLSRINNKELVQMYKQQFKQNMIDCGFKPGDIVSVAVLDKLKEQGINVPYKTGGDALEYLLKKIDPDKELDKARKELDKAKGKDIDKAYKKVRALEMIKKNNLKPEDLMVKYVPVAPSYLRPIIPQEERRDVLVNDMNKLYGQILTAKGVAEKEATLNNDGMIDPVGLAPVDLAQRSKNLYDSLKKLHGNLEAKDGDKKLTSTKDTLSQKTGIIRKEMLAKRVDFSGRSVITVNPNLGLNEIGLPMDMARQLYRPFIVKGLIDRGICANDAEAEKRIDNPDAEVKQVMQEIANDRPVFVNRQPSLHKFSIQAMKPVIKEYEDGGVVRSIQLNPLVVTGFNADFDGDTMAVHVPVTEKAKEEAKKVAMPYQNFINPSDGKMVIEIRHEMALGIYQLTNNWENPVGSTKTYTSFKQLEKDYVLGKITAHQRVKVPFSPQEMTAGQAMFNWLIPEKVKHYRNTRKVWTKNEVSKMLGDLYKEIEGSDFKIMSKLEFSKLFDQIKDLGFKASTRTGVSLGTSDFKFNDDIMKSINKIIQRGENEGATIEAWKKVEDDIESSLKKGLLPSDNALQIMMNSGARASAQQIRKMFATIGIGMDVSKNILDPIKHSHFDGLSPQDYYTLGRDSRKGIYDRSVSTAEPGALTRDVWAAVQDLSITEKDCKTREFINLKKSDKTIVGRYAGKDILSKKGQVICKRNQMITHEIFDKIYRDDTIAYVPVRSTLRCKTPNGKCQMCYGAMAGTLQPVKMGTAVGVIASQALGEPVTQMTMNTFHTGGANSAATLGLPRIENLLDLSKNPSNKAVLAQQSGTVTDIVETPTDVTVFIGKKKHVINKTLGNMNVNLKVKIGDIVSKGDFLTFGDNSDIVSAMSDGNKTTMVLSNADPKDLFKLKTESQGQDKALKYTRDYLSDSMQYAIQKSDAYMDRRHSEMIVSKLTGTGKVIDSGDSPYLKGQKADINLFERWNKENCTGTKVKEISPMNSQELVGRTVAMEIGGAGKVLLRKGQVITPEYLPILSKYPANIKVMMKPIKYEVILQGKGSASTSGEWFSNLAGTRGVGDPLSSGAMMGSVDNMQDPRSRLMAGKMINTGEAVELKDEFKDKLPNKMSNFFSSKMDDWTKTYKK